MPTLALVGEQWQACGKESYTRLQTGKGFHIPLSADLPHPSLQRSLLFILKANLTQQSSVEHLGTRHTLVSFLFCLSCFGFAKLLESANLYLSSTLGNVWQLFLYMFFFFFFPVSFLFLFFFLVSSLMCRIIFIVPLSLFILFQIILLSVLQSGYFLLICFQIH